MSGAHVIHHKPRSPSELRDVPCGRAPTGTFDIPDRGPTPRSRRARRYQVAVAMSYCNGIPSRAGCPFKLSCVTWALSANERGVYGGIEVTGAMLKNKRVALEKEVLRAQAEATAPANRSGQLAEPRSGREAGRGQPARA